ncbi:hypothetical protein H8D30_01985 [bacterium]|nr:hypothetical protein [bacterium]
MERANEIHEQVITLLDQRFMEGELNPTEESLRILLHNVRTMPDKAWLQAMEPLAESFLSASEIENLPGSPPEFL